MPNRQTHRHLRFLHTLVLFGVLCVLGVQTLEAQHDHAPDESFAECLLCQASTAAAVSTGAQAPVTPEAFSPSLTSAFAAPAQSLHSPQTARGPPGIS